MADETFWYFGGVPLYQQTIDGETFVYSANVVSRIRMAERASRLEAIAADGRAAVHAASVEMGKALLRRVLTDEAFVENNPDLTKEIRFYIRWV